MLLYPIYILLTPIYDILPTHVPDLTSHDLSSGGENPCIEAAVAFVSIDQPYTIKGVDHFTRRRGIYVAQESQPLRQFAYNIRNNCSNIPPTPWLIMLLLILIVDLSSMKMIGSPHGDL